MSLLKGRALCESSRGIVLYYNNNKKQYTRTSEFLISLQLALIQFDKNNLLIV